MATFPSENFWSGIARSCPTLQPPMNPAIVDNYMQNYCFVFSFTKLLTVPQISLFDYIPLKYCYHPSHWLISIPKPYHSVLQQYPQCLSDLQSILHFLLYKT